MFTKLLDKTPFKTVKALFRENLVTILKLGGWDAEAHTYDQCQYPAVAGYN
jgi:hypothetical protein